MPKQALYLKWRPTTFDDMIGQEHITRTLRNSLKTGRIRHAYLFSGPRGTGKTTSARLLAKAINCRDENPDNRPCNQCAACIAVNEGRYLDLIEIDAATHTGVDDVRDLRDKIAFSPGEGQYKVYVIDEVHRFSGSAFDALLKTLEEPPPHAVFVLATTEIDKVPATIKSRCLPFEFRRVPLQEVADRLQAIASDEGLNIERSALELIARSGTGSVRDSISLLDQIVSDPQEVITLEITQRILGTASIGAVKDLVEAIIAEDAGYGLQVINLAIDAGTDPRQFGQQVVEHLRAVLLTQTSSADLVEASHEDRILYEQQAGRIERGRILKAVRSFNDAVNNFKGGWQPQLSLELALIESLRADEIAVQYVAAPAAGGQTAALPPMPQAEALPPGSPPVIPPQTIRDQWVNLQRVARRYNSNLPALLDHASVRQVDGNLLILAVPNDMFREKLESADKLNALEHALNDMFKVQMRVRVMMGGADAPMSSAEAHPQLDMTDPLLSLGAELGAEIKPNDSKRHQDE